MVIFIKILVILMTNHLFRVWSATECFFAYDLLMNKSRLEKHIPVVSILGAAELPGFQLDFAMYSKVHHGCLPTVVEDTSNYSRGVGGVAYLVFADHIYRLDYVKGVWMGINSKANMLVKIGGKLRRVCWVYATATVEPVLRADLSTLPKIKAPSPTLIQEMRRIAKIFNLSKEYLELLDTVPDNGDYTPELQFPNPKLKKSACSCSKQDEKLILLLLLHMIFSVFRNKGLC